MSMLDCSQCQRLRQAYAAVTNTRLLAEVDLTSAIFRHDSAEIKRLKRRARSILARWARVAEALRLHEQSHVRVVGASPIS